MKRLIDDVAKPGSPKVHRYLLTWLLSAAPLEQLEPMLPAIQRWMEENPSASDVTTQYLDLATKAATPDVLVEVVRWASDYLNQTRRPWDKRDQAVFDPFHRADGPYDRLVWEYSNTSNPEEAKNVLTRAKRIMESWLSVWLDIASTQGASTGAVFQLHNRSGISRNPGTTPQESYLAMGC